MLIAKTEPVAVAVKLMVQVSLVSLQDRASDLADTSESPISGPNNHFIDGESLFEDRPFGIVFHFQRFKVVCQLGSHPERIGPVAFNTIGIFLLLARHDVFLLFLRGNKNGFHPWEGGSRYGTFRC